jgi:hypothetical protein
MRYRLAAIAGIVLAVALCSARSEAADLGLTPSHIVSLWTNINSTLLTAAEIVRGPEGRTALEAMTAKNFPGKSPRDVQDKVVEFRTKLDTIVTSMGLDPTTTYADPHGGDVTPSVVFMNSGYVLDSMVRAIIGLDGQRLVSGFYTRHDLSGLSPGDAYAQVDLANRRLDVIQPDLQ